MTATIRRPLTGRRVLTYLLLAFAMVVTCATVALAITGSTLGRVFSRPIQLASAVASSIAQGDLDNDGTLVQVEVYSFNDDVWISAPGGVD